MPSTGKDLTFTPVIRMVYCVMGDRSTLDIHCISLRGYSQITPSQKTELFCLGWFTNARFACNMIERLPSAFSQGNVHYSSLSKQNELKLRSNCVGHLGFRTWQLISRPLMDILVCRSTRLWPFSNRNSCGLRKPCSAKELKPF